MKYCCYMSQRDGTCYHEFQKGEFLGQYWSEDSLLIHDVTLHRIELNRLFRSAIPTYDIYSATRVTREDWDKVYDKAQELGGEILEAVEEIDAWAEETFEEYDCFSIIGI